MDLFSPPNENRKYGFVNNDKSRHYVYTTTYIQHTHTPRPYAHICYIVSDTLNHRQDAEPAGVGPTKQTTIVYTEESLHRP